jgi:hypothetical protein
LEKIFLFGKNLLAEAGSENFGFYLQVKNKKRREITMNWNEIRFKNFTKPVRGFLKFNPKMESHPELKCLQKFQKGGIVEVEITGHTKIGDKILFSFYPKQASGVKRMALADFFEISGLEKILSSL